MEKEYYEDMKAMKDLTDNGPENFSDEIALAYWTEKYDSNKIQTENELARIIGNLNNIPIDDDLNPQNYARLYLASAFFDGCRQKIFKEKCKNILQNEMRI